MTQRPRPRTGSRVAAVQALFQSEQAGTSPETVIDEFIRHRLGVAPHEDAGYEDGRVPEADVALFAAIVRGAVRQQDVIDRLVAESLPKEWPFARLDPVLRALLRAGGAELAKPGVPARVVINEYLDVAHGFFAGDEPRMVNGMLDRMARELRPGEFPPKPVAPPAEEKPADETPAEPAVDENAAVDEKATGENSPHEQMGDGATQ